MLLQACLTQNEEAAIAAWRRWKATASLDRIDAGSYRLLPLVAWRLNKLGLKESLLPLLQGCMKQTWVATQLIHRTAATIARGLKARGIPTLIFKGVALDLQAYPARGLRPMLDLDIAVHRSNSVGAWDTLVQLGWAPGVSRDRVTSRYLMAVEFKHPNFGSVDLHFCFFHESLDSLLTENLWGRAITLKVHGEDCLSLCSSDQLFHVLAHGLRSNPLPPIRWIADSVIIIRSGSIDWERFLYLATYLRCRLTMLHGLAYLVEKFDIDIPSHVIASLQAPYELLERFEFALGRHRGFGTLLILSRYVRLNAGVTLVKLLTGLPRHLQEVWEKPTLTATFAALCVKMARAAKRLIVNSF